MILDPLAAKAADVQMPCETLHVIARACWETNVSATKKVKADAILMPSHGSRRVSATQFGREAQKALKRSKLPVIVVR